MKIHARWYVVLAALAVVGIAALAVNSLVDPADDRAPLPSVVGPSMPPGYTVDWVPVGDHTYPCVAYYRSVSCDFSRPSPTPGSTPS